MIITSNYNFNLKSNLNPNPNANSNPNLNPTLNPNSNGNANAMIRYWYTHGLLTNIVLGNGGNIDCELSKRLSQSKNAELKELAIQGVAFHHAGMLRDDRKLSERLFAKGDVKLLCCTATLAWGVNLPVRTVIIKGTEIYNAEKGTRDPISMLDVLQIFGRAGRPQFDDKGEAAMICSTHEHLARYVR